MELKNQNIMSPEIRNFSYMIDEQFEIVDNPNKGFWAFILNFFK